jgi:pyrroline-5-carboxylate reductase
MKIAILGCGNMGIAYARSFLKYDLVTKQSLLLIEKDQNRQKQLEELNFGVVTSELNEEVLKVVDILILSVKPQDFDSLKEKLKKSLNNNITIISIMAGKTLDFICTELDHTCVVRAMPNSPAIVGMGITAYVTTEAVDMARIRKVEQVLNSTGRSVFLESESLMDAVTALSGSGPAYFFYIVKNMIKAGVEMGMEPHVAALLVKQTLLGSYHLMNAKEVDLDELIKGVASKGGTTEAALNYFNQNNLDNALIGGIKRAEERGKELAVIKS